MSSSRLSLDDTRKAGFALSPERSPSAAAMGPEALPTKDLHAARGTSRVSDAGDAILHGVPDRELIEAAAAHFADFASVSYKDRPSDDDITMISLPGNDSSDLFGPHSSLPSPSHTDTDVAAAASTCALSNAPPMALTLPEAPSPIKRPIESVLSENGSPDSNSRGAPNSLLDEPMSDEFGLVTNRPVDTAGLDSGAATTTRPSQLVKDEKTGDVAPPWSELKTKAGKERKRLPLACIACRRKKIRCSGEKPACKHCLRSRIPCVYKVTTRKAAPRTDYMAMLDKRLKRMEDRIIKVVPKAEQDVVASLSSVVRAVVKPSIPGVAANSSSASGSNAGNGASASKAGMKKRQAEEAFGTDLDHWARANNKGAATTLVQPRTLLLQQESEENKLLQEGAGALPSRELQEHLAEVYFENIYGQAYHLLHKPSYMRKLKAGTLPPVLILSVCAVSARFSSHPKLGCGPNFLRGEEWASHARDIVMRRYEWPNITILTCLLLLGLHEFGTCHGGRSWSLGGQAIRMAFALQLHKDVQQDPRPIVGDDALSFVDREIRRRTMWACFMMDRLNSSGTDRPTFIKEETIKIQLPIKEKNFQLDMPGPTENLAGRPVTLPLDMADGLDDVGQHFSPGENMGVAAYMVRTIAIWGRVISYLNQGGKELDPHPMWSPDSEYSKLVVQADEMLSSLPSTLVYSAENLHIHETGGMANQFLFLHISIQQNILFLNRFAVSSPNSISQKDIPKTFVTKAGAKAFGAANRISDLLKETETYLVSAPFVGYCAFLSSTVHIFGIFSGNPMIEATSKRNLTTNVKFLSKMKRYWGMFHFMAENLREQYRTCADAARQGTPASENAAASSPIFQYGDWFDRYPHGVSNSDFVDPVGYTKKEKGDDAVLGQKPELHTVEEFFTTMGAGVDGAASSTGSNHSNMDQAMGSRLMAQSKRRSFARKGGGSISSRGTDQQSLISELAAANADVLQQQQHAQSQMNNFRRHSRTSISSAPGNIGPLALAQAQAQNTAAAAAAAAAAASFHSAVISPLSASIPGFSQQAHRHVQQQQQQRQQQQQQQTSQFYSSDLLPLSLAQQTNTILPQLDRQLVFGAYGNLDSAVTAMENQTTLDGLDWDGPGPGDCDNLGVSSAATGTTATAHSELGLSMDTLNGFGHSNEPSSAWFMPFNMDPPEIGQDLGGIGNLDHFASIFGAAVTQKSGSGNNSLHHG